MRTFVAIALFAACVLALTPDLTGQQPDPKQPDAKKAQPKAAEPKLYPPDAATLKQIQAKTEQLRQAVEALKEEKIPDDHIKDIRTSIERCRPYGSATWIQKTASRLGLEFTLRPRGRPKKELDDGKL